jgi:hypothetical protein
MTRLPDDQMTKDFDLSGHPVIRSSSHLLTRWDVLKIIALLLMFIDHAGAFYYMDEQWLRAIGRACAPIFFFLAGFAPHYKFDTKLLVLAFVLSGVDWWLAGAPNTLNILFTILAIRALLAWLEQRGLLKLRLHEWVIGSLALVPSVLVLQYGTFGLLFALAGFVFKHRAHYAPRTPLRFLILVTAIYAPLVPLLSEFSLGSSILTALCLGLMSWLILWFTQAPKQPVSLPAMLKYPAKYTSEIYVAHLLVLMLMTGEHL